jgi:hypothetical protein
VAESSRLHQRVQDSRWALGKFSRGSGRCVSIILIDDQPDVIPVTLAGRPGKVLEVALDGRPGEALIMEEKIESQAGAKPACSNASNAGYRSVDTPVDFEPGLHGPSNKFVAAGTSFGSPACSQAIGPFGRSIDGDAADASNGRYATIRLTTRK